MTRPPSGADEPEPGRSSPADYSLRLAEGIVLDVRRAAWFPAERLLAVADTHIGHAWVERLRGRLVPVDAVDTTVSRLGDLMAAYRPVTCVIAGDIVHAAAPIPALEGELRLLAEIARSHGTRLQLVLGNHDHDLPSRLQAWQLNLPCSLLHQAGPFRFVHGDAPAPAWTHDRQTPQPWLIIGHEHPALTLGDGLTRSARCPSFLLAERLLVLPAFTSLAAGCDLLRGSFLGPIAREATFTAAIACVGRRLLRLPFPPPRG